MSTSESPADSGIPDIPLPPVIDANFPLVDSAATRDRQSFPCGRLSGAVTADLVCDHVYPELNWDVEPGSGTVSIEATLAPRSGIDASTAVLGFTIPTPPRMSRLIETCATLPPPTPNDPQPFFSSSFVLRLIAGWTATCGGMGVPPGGSFELVITSVGTLTSDAVGADPLDASADVYPWSTLNTEVLSNSFHGTLKATLVAVDGGPALDVDMTF